MNFFSRINIKLRILLLVLIPLFATLFFAVERYVKADNEMKEVERLEVLQQYIYNATPLVSSLQVEHLYTKMYMGRSYANPSLEFEQSMHDSRVPVDKALVKYSTFVADTDKFALFPGLQKDIIAIKKRLELFPTIRKLVNQRIRNKDFPDGKKYTINEIRALTFALIDSTQAVVLLTSGNKELSLLANAYQNLILAKHNALIANGEAYHGIKNEYSAYVYSTVNKTFSLEEAYIEGFKNFAPPHLDQQFDKTIGDKPYFQQAQKDFRHMIRRGTRLVGQKLDINIDEWLKNGVQVNAAYEDLATILLDEIEKQKNSMLDNAKSSLYNTIILIVVLLAVLLFISLQIISSITQPLDKLVNMLSNLARTKDMTMRYEVTGTDELNQVGEALNSLISDFEKTLGSVKQQIDSMSKVTSDVSSSMHQSIGLINNQKQSTDSISVATEEMTASIHEVSDMAVSTSDTVLRANELSSASEKDAIDSRAAMGQLFEELGDTSALVEDLNNEANQISNIVQVIKGISEQTNLLALNAAIEAARAGEAGRGFAVVADEVRQLSKRTQDSTEQIESQISMLLEGASTASKKMDTLHTNGIETVQAVQKSSDAFVAIKAEMDKITEMATQIATASTQQAKTSDEINQRIHTIKSDSEIMLEQGNATLSSTDTLQANAESLRNDINVFKF
ncbi:hypothetical protein C2869_07095 [Saccharobesus litoralis]|uniref:Methyl-accepting chemotaxis protein n=1 Tax=Saccharobesus litoralis TaxID=2172099 RepID=A0A2S0VPT2_9ALTE|nr:methyl-accepting chemotaxis protein [Saccharobesus litoralis]AWB66214.1 hypothetical protein C2869_07095 [Saccharobesus litoralis]